MKNVAWLQLQTKKKKNQEILEDQIPDVLKIPGPEIIWALC